MIFKNGIKHEMKLRLTPIMGVPDNRGIILMYHRVANLERDPQQLAVTPEHFEAQVKYLSENFEIMPLEQLVNYSRSNEIPKGSIAITFDDGYMDNFTNAKPILEKYRAPATVFVTTGLINKYEEPWWDELETIVFYTPHIPNEYYHKSLGATLKFKTEKDKQTSYKLLYDFMMSQQCHKQIRMRLNELYETLQINRKSRLENRIMDAQSIVALESTDLIKIGAHTIDHPILSKLHHTAQERQIGESKKQLEAIVNHEITTFSYPYGAETHFNEENINTARDCSYHLACANVPGTIKRRVDVYALPRFIVRDWDVDIFKKHIKMWFNA